MTAVEEAQEIAHQDPDDRVDDFWVDVEEDSVSERSGLNAVRNYLASNGSSLVIVAGLFLLFTGTASMILILLR